MDQRFDFPRGDIADLTLGTLVKVTYGGGWGEFAMSDLGIVIEVNHKNNQTLFPSVVVYSLKSGKKTRQYAGSLEVISKMNE